MCVTGRPRLRRTSEGSARFLALLCSPMMHTHSVKQVAGTFGGDLEEKGTSRQTESENLSDNIKRRPARSAHCRSGRGTQIQKVTRSRGKFSSLLPPPRRLLPGNRRPHSVGISYGGGSDPPRLQPLTKLPSLRQRFNGINPIELR